MSNQTLMAVAVDGEGACPPESAVLDFLSDRLPEADRDQLSEHLDRCTDCQGRLETFCDDEELRHWRSSERACPPLQFDETDLSDLCVRLSSLLARPEAIMAQHGPEQGEQTVDDKVGTEAPIVIGEASGAADVLEPTQLRPAPAAPARFGQYEILKSLVDPDVSIELPPVLPDGAVEFMWTGAIA
jgi:hypothetical protein